MLISQKWLQEYFKDKLPKAKELAEILTMHSFEIESVKGEDGSEIIDAKILPNRTHDCLCHKGIGREISTLLGKKFVDREVESAEKTESESNLKIKTDDPKLCPRYMGRRIENISVKDSPDWLKEKLESLGERAINNVVDITNYIMLDLGQPMHAFDADKVGGSIHVRQARKNEKIGLLGSEEATLDESVLLIADDTGPLAIAGIKGGQKAEVTTETKNIILESANFNPELIRKTSQKLGIKNNSSKRYENGLSPDLTESAMKYATKLVLENAAEEKTKTYKIEDLYLHKRNPYKVGISLSEANKLLGADLKEREVVDILNKTGWEWEKVNPVKKVKTAAQKLLGRPYELGASVSYDAPEKFDCSSLIAYVFAGAGISLPRMSVDQYVYSERIKREELEVGDLIFLNTGIRTEKGTIYYKSIEWMGGTEVPDGIDHVGLYLGEDKIIYTSSTTNAVIVEKLSASEFFTDPMCFGRITTLKEERFVVTVPYERLDLRIKEDLVEEIGRIYGYENIKPILPENASGKPKANETFKMTRKNSLALTNLGYSEIYNYAFREKGEVKIENPIASDKSFLRNNLRDGLKESLEMNWRNAPLLGLDEIKIFEIGTVFEKDSEQINVAWGIKNKKEIKVEECELKMTAEKMGTKESGVSNLSQPKDVKFKPFSSYPFILRDIAVWTPKGTRENEVLKIILENTGNLLVQKRLFDQFEKGDRVSYAFSLVFQSSEKTLTDPEINEIMEKTTAALNSQSGWQVR